MLTKNPPQLDDEHAIESLTLEEVRARLRLLGLEPLEGLPAGFSAVRAQYHGKSEPLRSILRHSRPRHLNNGLLALSAGVAGLVVLWSFYSLSQTTRTLGLQVLVTVSLVALFCIRKCMVAALRSAAAVNATITAATVVAMVVLSGAAASYSSASLKRPISKIVLVADFTGSVDGSELNLSLTGVVDRWQGIQKIQLLRCTGESHFQRTWTLAEPEAASRRTSLAVLGTESESQMHLNTILKEVNTEIVQGHAGNHLDLDQLSKCLPDDPETLTVLLTDSGRSKSQNRGPQNARAGKLVIVVLADNDQTQKMSSSPIKEQSPQDLAKSRDANETTDADKSKEIDNCGGPSSLECIQQRRRWEEQARILAERQELLAQQLEPLRRYFPEATIVNVNNTKSVIKAIVGD